MRALLVVAALGWVVGGAVPAVAVIGAAGAIYLLRSPDRLFDALYVVAFCGVGYLAG